jgi:hypothetical protein
MKRYLQIFAVLLLLLSINCGRAQQNDLVPKFTDVVERVFDGTLNGLVVSGDVKATSETDLSFEARFTVKRNDLGVEVLFKIEDRKCDYQNIEVTYGTSILMGGRLKRALDLVCKYSPSTSICSDTSRIAVAKEVTRYNLLSTSTGTVLNEITLSTETLANISQPIKTALSYVGAKLEIDILNPKLMVAGMNFSIHLDVSAFTPNSNVCNAIGSSACSSISVELKNINLGKEILLWLRENNNNYRNGEPLSWLQSDGTFVIGTNSLTCLPTPGSFSFDVKGDDLAKILENTDDIRNALVKVANECLPSGYTVSKNIFQNISISQNSDGTYSVDGLAYSGASKDAAGVLAATRQCIEENADSLLIGGEKVKISGFQGDKNCAAAREKGPSNVCNTKAPPSSRMIDGDQTVNNKNTFDNDPSNTFSMVEVIIITVCLTLTVVFVVYFGFTKYQNYKRRIHVRSGNVIRDVDNVDRFERNSMFDFNLNPVNIAMGDTKRNNMKSENHTQLVEEVSTAKVPSTNRSWEDVAIAKRNAKR